jgi:hypothetical protein
MTAALLPKGAPPRDDVEAAARQLAEYQRTGGLTPDGVRLFFRLVAKPTEVMTRANELIRTKAGKENDAAVDDALTREDRDEVVTIVDGKLVRRRAGQPDELVGG